MLHPTSHTIQTLLSHQEAPCVSIYVPTHRTGHERGADPIAFRALVERIRPALQTAAYSRHGEAILRRLDDLAADKKFWGPAQEGIAVLLNPQQLHVFRLERPVKELAVCAQSFHIKPLLRIVQSADRFHVLCLSSRTVRLLEGNRYVLEDVNHPGIAMTADEALGPEVRDPQRTVPYGSTAGGRDSLHSHGERKDEKADDLEHFFRVVDRQVTRHLSQPSRLPLVLIGLPQQQAVFRRVSKNPFLVERGLAHHPDGKDVSHLHNEVWEIVRPLYKDRLETIKDDMRYARAHGLGSDDLTDIGKAVAAGRVATLLVDADRSFIGEVDAASGAVKFVPAAIHGDDVLDDLAESVLRKHGEVIVCPTDEMPTASGACAIYRF